MAPEIRGVNEGSSHNFKVDIWALGILLYELLEERFPFDEYDNDMDGEDEGINNNKKDEGRKITTTILMTKEVDFNRLEFSEKTSIEARKLIKDLLAPKPKNRMELEEVLNHSWIQQQVRRDSLGVLGKDCCSGTGDFGDDDNKQELNIISWNVNGLKSVLSNGTLKYCIKKHKPDIICLQEIKINSEAFKLLLLDKEDWLKDYYIYVNCAHDIKEPGREPYHHQYHHGSMVLAKKERPIVEEVRMGMGVKKHDLQGRMITLVYLKFIIVAVYAPNPGKEDIEKMRYRTEEWDPAFIRYISCLKEKDKEKEIIIIGDLNVSHNQELDFCCNNISGKNDEDTNATTTKITATTKAETQNFNDLLGIGELIDTYRYLYPLERNCSTLSNGSRRLDYALVSQSMMFGTVRNSLIIRDFKGSDHYPIQLILSLCCLEKINL